jgi:effector-binding domain-containing protein
VVQAVRLVETVATPTAVVKESTSWEDFPSLWGPLLDEVWRFVRGSGLAAGRNVMLYKDDVPNVEVGVEVATPFTAGVRVVPSALPAGLVATTVVRGAPSAEGIAQGHAAVLGWCEVNGHELTGARWEIYGHWQDDQDPTEFEIEVYWLLQA